MSISRRTLLIFGLLVLAAVPVLANHAWNGYHWARTSNPFTLKTGDNVDSNWDAYLDGAISDWSQSIVLDLLRVPGQTNPRSCRPTSGRIEVCNASYGNTGWLGIAQIWVSGNHITQATTKLNDTYFNTSTYNTPPWRRFVTCQEVGHDFGLAHQDETFNNANLGSCMDYTNDPDGGPGGASETDPSNEHPNAHDYEEIEIIYSHLDSFTTITSASLAALSRPTVVAGDDLDQPWRWGTPVEWDREGRARTYVLNVGDGDQVLTRVLWVQDGPEREGADRKY